jgi:uncharacterized ion transporter superfamily protein YfcC
MYWENFEMTKIRTTHKLRKLKIYIYIYIVSLKKLKNASSRGENKQNQDNDFEMKKIRTTQKLRKLKKKKKNEEPIILFFCRLTK